MRVDLIGRLRKTRVPVSRPLLPVFEAVANAVHAIFDAKRGDGVIEVELRRGPTFDQGKKGPISDVVISDNGVGFTDDNFAAFQTADTMRKAAIGGKGVGRFTWLVAFDSVTVASSFGPDAQRRVFSFSRNGVELIDQPDGVLIPDVGTRVQLSGLNEPWRDRVPIGAELIAADMIEHFIALFASSRAPKIWLVDDGDRIDMGAEFARTYDQSTTRIDFQVGDQHFHFTPFRLRRSQGGRFHRLLYLADEREVKTERLSALLPGLPNPFEDDSGSFHFVGVVQGVALDRNVDHDRSSFLLPDERDPNEPALLRELTWKDIRDGALGCTRRVLDPWIQDIEQEKRRLLERFVDTQEPHYKVLIRDAEDILPDLPPNPAPSDLDRVLSRRLFERRERLKLESEKLLSDLEKVDQADPDAYREMMEKTVQEQNQLGMADLARYICHRRVILELFEKSLKMDSGTGKFGREDAVHSIVYPMRKTSLDVDYYGHNLWLLDERLAYNWRVYSDLPFRAMDVGEIQSRQEPDLIIFDRPFIVGDQEIPLMTATIIEFKRPGRTDYGKERVTTQVYDYLERLRRGRFKDFEGRTIRIGNNIPVCVYVIADLEPALERELRDANMRRTPDQGGFYAFQDDLGAYVEVLSYDKMLAMARKRNWPFFSVLGISTRNR